MRRYRTAIVSLGLAICLLLPNADIAAGRTAPQAMPPAMGIQALSLAVLCSVHEVLNHPIGKVTLRVFPQSRDQKTYPEIQPSSILTARLKLTSRQAEVLRLYVLGRSPKEIAEHLGISDRTVEYHKYELLGRLRPILSKSEQEEAHEMLIGAFKAGWIQPALAQQVAGIIADIFLGSFTVRKLDVLTMALRNPSKGRKWWAHELRISRRTIEFHIYGVIEVVAHRMRDILSQKKSLILDTRWDWDLILGYLLTPQAGHLRKWLFSLQEHFMTNNVSGSKLLRVAM